MVKTIATLAAASGLMMSTALAQSPSSTPSDAPKAAPQASTQPALDGKFVQAQKPEQWLATKFKGTDVIGDDNQKIGDVTDILFEKDGKIVAYIVSVGGFLGIGAKEVALAPSSFQLQQGDKANPNDVKLKLSTTKDQLKQAANFEHYNAPTRMNTGATAPGMAPRPLGSAGSSAPAPSPMGPGPVTPPRGPAQ
jgi:hypothetical protein